MKSKVKKILCISAMAGLMLCSFGGVAYAQEASAENIANTDILTQTGASIRYKAETDGDTDKSGIRFSGYVSESYLTSHEGAEVGMLIIPATKLGESVELTDEVDGVGISPATVYAVEDEENDKEGYKRFTTVLWGIPASDYGTQIVARAYVKFDSVYTFADFTETRSIAQVASIGLSKGDSHVEELNAYITATNPTISVESTASVGVGKNVSLGVTVTPAGLVPIYESSNKEVATVDVEGNVTGVSAGEAEITVKLGNEVKTVAVTVAVPVVKGGQVFADKYAAKVAGGNYAINVGAVEGAVSSVTLSAGAKTAELTTASYADNVLTVPVADVDSALSAQSMSTTGSGYFTLNIATDAALYNYDAVMASKIIKTETELRNWAYYVRPDNWANNKANNYNGLVVLGNDIVCEQGFSNLELSTYASLGGTNYPKVMFSATIPILVDCSKCKGAGAPTEADCPNNANHVTASGYDSRFYGTFDGMGHTISNFYAANGSKGLLGEYPNCTVKNLNIIGKDLDGSNVGSLVGNQTGILAREFRGVAENINIEVAIYKTSSSWTGVFAGAIKSSTTKLTNVVCKLTYYEPSTVGTTVGVLCGELENSVKLTNVYAIGQSSVAGALNSVHTTYADEAAFKQSVTDGTISLAWAEESPYWKVVDNMPVFVGAAE